MRKAAHQRGTKAGLELMKFAAIDDAGNDLAHIKRLARVGGNHAVKLLAVVERRHGLAQLHGRRLLAVERGHGLAGQGNGVRVVLRQVVGHA